MTAEAELEVALGERAYDLLIGPTLLDRAGREIRERLGQRRVVVVLDANLRRTAHPMRLMASLDAAGLAASELAVPPGEASKSWGELERLVGRLLDLGPERGTVVAALGGGVIGDLAGFAAAITLRGLDFVQMPTTLLAQVDSSVGGKTGINTAHGKNLVGAFHQPRLVLVDTSTLDDLPERELRAGYAEVVKHAFIKDAGYFDWLEQHGAALLAGDPAARTEAIARSLAIKAAVVKADERETTGERALLNFGHTFAHAYEKLAGFDGRLLHGEAVSLGMARAFRLSRAMGMCPGQDVGRALAHLERLGMPVRASDLGLAPFGTEAVLEAMRADKKVDRARIRFVCLERLGRAVSGVTVGDDVVREVLAEG
ncbi:MAG TPA: 3-dehydroquinate synthase [Geminicoccaceae bacterium]|nr:3-dehydroquinate synthase [Geminicoccus sp.]HMU51874.1 3-dehydroquinate synthase [Geminicoccaceae bacterium]